MAVKAPQNDDVPTQGESTPGRGTNPLSGPVIVIGILIGAMVVFGIMIAVGVGR